MPRPRKPDGQEPKSRSRNGCWSCKARKVKCTEERPNCSKCVKGGYQCDYGIRLNWDGRRSKRPQLKAIHLDTGSPTLGGADVDDGDHFDVRTVSASLDGTRLVPAKADAQTDAPLDLTNSPPLSTSSRSSTSTSTGAPVQTQSAKQIALVPVQAPNPLKRPGTNSWRNSARMPTTAAAAAASSAAGAAVADGLFRVLTPAAMDLSTTFQFDHQPASTLQPRRRSKGGAALDASKGSKSTNAPWRFSAAAPRAASMSVSDGLFSEAVDIGAGAGAGAGSGADGMDRASKRPRLDSEVSEIDFAWAWPISPSAGSGSASYTGLSPTQTTYAATVGGEAQLLQLGGDDGVGSPNGDSSRRMSVHSLLSGPHSFGAAASASATALPIPSLSSTVATDGDLGCSTHRRHRHTDGGKHDIYYGIDAGFRDSDLGKNDDANALSPPKCSGSARSFGKNEDVYGPGGYYEKPVFVRISRALGPLPSKLTEHPMNMLYFHHFLNNTARVLVPHDDPASNPFRTILPQMALKNDNLLSLLLAYSASHRARVLDHPEPEMRIAFWVQEIFPALRNALDDHKQKISNANVATAIMLSSLAIVSPTAFGYNIPWQKHLLLARDLIAARPEGLRVQHHSSLEGQVCSFLWSWFAYIDVIGGLSGGATDASPAWILDYKVYDEVDDDEVDCIMGFTTCCIYILAEIAELVRQCEPERLRFAKLHGGRGWVPSADVVRKVEMLEAGVRSSMLRKPRACAHLQRSGDVVRWDSKEMAATNEAYHWAALVHLHRRALGKPATHPDVQNSVKNIIACINKVRIGGTAENCLLFPVFTAGCESIDEGQRQMLLKRMASIEGTGMMQVTRARSLMQKSWGRKQPWETILTTEFIG